MDRTSIIVIVICFVLLGLWSYVLVPKLYPPKPLPPGFTNAPITTLTATNQPATSPAAPSLVEAPATVPTPLVNTNVPEELRQVKTARAQYTFTSYGGGLKLVELLAYPETISQTNRPATLNTVTPAPTLALLGSEAIQGDGIFKLTPTQNGRGAKKPLTNGLSIIKEFEISTNYLVVATARLENRSPQPLTLPPQEWVVGTATPMGARDNGQAVGVLWYNGSKTEDVSAGWFANRTLGCIPGVPRTEYRGTSNVVWVAAHNQFFALAAMPAPPAPALVARK